MITGRQLRAARSLLDWTAQDLATKSGLTRETVSRIEADTVQARDESLNKILKVLEEQRIEFLDNQGVRFRPEGLQVFSGTEGIRLFLDHVYAYAQTNGGILRQNGIEDEIFFKNALPIAIAHRDRMNLLKQSRDNVIVHVLMKQSDTEVKCPIYAMYKWLPKTAPMPVPYYVYGDSVGLFAVGDDLEPKIYQITSPTIATAYINQFDSSWNTAMIDSKGLK